MNKKPKTMKTGTHTCPWWLLFTFDNPIRKLLHDPEKILSPYVKKGDKILDVGCGMGYFTLPLAKLVGKSGKVIAADLQEKMLAGLRNRAERTGLLSHIELHLGTRTQIGVHVPIDFALAFWMVHEVRQPTAFFEQIYNILNPGGKFLVAEPIIHVSGKSFEQLITLAKSVGFQAVQRPMVHASRAVLLQK